MDSNFTELKKYNYTKQRSEQREVTYEQGMVAAEQRNAEPNKK